MGAGPRQQEYWGHGSTVLSRLSPGIVPLVSGQAVRRVEGRLLEGRQDPRFLELHPHQLLDPTSEPQNSKLNTDL